MYASSPYGSKKYPKDGLAKSSDHLFKQDFDDYFRGPPFDHVEHQGQSLYNPQLMLARVNAVPASD